MKFTASRETILAALQKVIGVIERRQTLPILANTLIRVNGDRIVFTGTDLEIQLVVETQIEGMEDGLITVPARKLADICKLLPEAARISVDLRDDKLCLKSGRSRFSLSTLAASQFPEFSRSDFSTALTLERSRLRKALEKTIFCMAQQDVRYYLNGLLLEMEDDCFRAVASDGHRLALYEDHLQDRFDQRSQIIMPRKGVLELFKLLDDSERTVTLEFSDNAICITVDDVVFSAKLIDGKFPDFRKVIPEETARTIVLDRDQFRQALNRVAIISNEKFHGISLNISQGLLTLSAHNPEQEVAEEEIEIQYLGEPLNIGFNASYLLDAVTNIDSDRVHLSFTDHNSSCLVEDPENPSMKFIVMPMRL